jgi:hypothetical protein
MTRPSDPIQFTRESAERIASVIRATEVTPRPGKPLTFEPYLQADTNRRVFRMCTFTGAWDIETYKTVTFRNITTMPNTVEAINVFVSLGTSASDPRPCAIAKDGTAWYLIAAACD